MESAAETAKTYVESWINGNRNFVRDEITKMKNRKYALAIMAYLVHYLPDEDVPILLRVFEAQTY